MIDWLVPWTFVPAALAQVDRVAAQDAGAGLCQRDSFRRAGPAIGNY